MSGQESPKPCPRCGSMPVIDPGLEGHEAAPGLEYYSCPTVFTVDGEEWSCGEHAQGLKAWNHRPAQIARVEEAVRVIADLAGCAKWRAAGEPDPHGTRYDCDRAALPMGNLSDDEMANGVYLHGDAMPPIEELLSGKAKTGGMGLDAAKNRIRWLSRKLFEASTSLTALQAEAERSHRQAERAAILLTEAVAQIGKAEAERDAAVARAETAEGLLSRKGFPILGSRGASIDWQLVADHRAQAQTNQGQSLSGLAGRGGLSWCELHAVLHDRRWQKMDSNEAMIACRALEARYLAALRDSK